MSARKTQCKRGHAFNEKNTYVDPRGSQQCRRCQATARSLYRARQRKELLAPGKVFVYRNLNRRGVVWSVKSVRTGRVVDRAETVYLRDCSFYVSAAGRQRVLESRRRNVHAGVRGFRGASCPEGMTFVRVKYNPYELSMFVECDTGAPVWKAEYVMLCRHGCFILKPKGK